MGGSVPAVETRGLTVRYGELAAVVAVDLRVERASLTALVGPSGCGKTTLLRAIAGFEPPAEGWIEIAGRRVAEPSGWLAPERRRVTMVFQDGALFPHLTVWRNVLYGAGRGAAGEARARRALGLVGLEQLAGRYPDELSGGQQQRVALARALAPKPRLVLLDEPFAALDATLRQRLRAEVRSVLAAAGATALLVTHDQQEALSMADRVAVMRGGRILQAGTPERVYRQPASAAVAEVLGAGTLLAVTVAAGRLRGPLGEAPCSAPDGPGRMLLRPEDLKLLPSGSADGVEARVIDRRFFGHDVLELVELASGERLEVRVAAERLAELGEPVRLALRDGPFTVFPPAEPEPPVRAG